MLRPDESSEDRAAELIAERAVNERYLAERLRSGKTSRLIQASAVGPRNGQWVGTADGAVPAPVEAGPLAGRVALGAEDPDLGSSFYVGSWHAEFDGVFVVSWAAPVATLFYEGRRATHELARDLLAARSFVTHGEDLIDYDDEMLGQPEPGRSPFARTELRLLRVAPAPGRVARPSGDGVAPRRPRAVAGPAGRRQPNASFGNEGPQAGKPPTATPAPAASSSSAADSDRATLRAERAVLEAVNRPRSGKLGAVLSTLQPDQYRLVTVRDDTPLAVQGQPGTGKTVIAAHRAAYLVHPDRKPRPNRRVAFVGPTAQWSLHVSDALVQLGAPDAAVEVIALPDLLRRLAGTGTGAVADEPERWLDGALTLAPIIMGAAAAMHRDRKLTGDAERDTRTVLKALLGSTNAARGAGWAEEQRSWVCELGTVERARTLLRYQPFLAAVGLTVKPVPAAAMFDHVVVDEAQDVRPLELWILSKHLRAGRATAWSLFGDMNQRRSDWTCTSWNDLGQVLQRCGCGHPATHELHRGFRSTRRILRFANQLLPVKERKVDAIREGVDPLVVKVKPAGLPAAVVDSAQTLAQRHRSGQISVITAAPQALESEFRRRGWSRSRTRNGWKRADLAVEVLEPDRARGLEFDGVVVVEPSAYPENLGRHGVLYTSLTRATQELTVVHSRPLPSALRAPSKPSTKARPNGEWRTPAAGGWETAG